jgi:[acyl-carrier-protein] S-malonyltransferase
MKRKRTILIFPGQGSQYVGMGKELYDKFKLVRDIYDEASQVLGYDISELCFKKHKFGKFLHKADLNKTIYTQPAVLTMSYACFKALDETCKENDVDLNVSLLAGHSLGEYTALLVAEAIDFKTILTLVHKRATLMTEWGKSYPGAGLMAVVDKGKELDNDKICALCKDFGVFITLNNTKSQIVVGGSKKRLAEMGKELKSNGLRSTMLKVEGPFHTPIMKPAADKFKKELEECEIDFASKPIMANVTSEAIVDPKHIRQELYKQMFNVVDWRGTIERIISKGENTFIEVGPKRVLSNMIKDIDPSVARLNIEDIESLEKTVKGMQDQQVFDNMTQASAPATSPTSGGPKDDTGD